MKTSFVLKDDTMPRTHFYHEFLKAAINNTRFSDGPPDHDTVLFPAEECSPSLNWPRFDDFRSAFVRGAYSDKELAKYSPYLLRFCSLHGLKCVFNMNPGTELASILKDRSDIIVCDINLLWKQRAENERSISLPALPITSGDGGAGNQKEIFASFRGYRSHPSRDSLRELHNGCDVICNVLEQRGYAAGIDYTTGAHDTNYVELLKKSIFAFVPRGDVNFSYRLLEVMSFGCIPVVLSDGWVLPLDHCIDWSEICFQYPEAETAWAVHRLRRTSDRRIAAMQAAAHDTYLRRFSSIDRVTEALFEEVEHVIRQ